MLIYCLLRLFCPLLKGKLNVPLAPEKWLKPSHREKKSYMGPPERRGNVTRQSATGDWQLAFGKSRPVTRERRPVTGKRRSSNGSHRMGKTVRQSTNGNSQPTIGKRRQATGKQRSPNGSHRVGGAVRQSTNGDQQPTSEKH